MSDTKKNLTHVLHYLNDSIKGLTNCAENSKSQPFKLYLMNTVAERMVFANKLNSMLVEKGGEATESGTLAGPLHRVYIDLKSFITDSNKVSIKTEILRGDKILVKAYNDAIQDETDEFVKQTLSNQLNLIHKELTHLTQNESLFSND